MKYPWIIACLIAAAGCGRGIAPQQSEPVTVTNYVQNTDTVEIAPDFFVEKDCGEAVAKCEADVNSLLSENAGLKEQLAKSGKKVKIKNSYNVDNSQVITLRKSNQMLAQDNARLKADSAVMADKIKTGNKSGNTKEANNWWVWFLLGAASWQLARIGLKRVPIFGKIFAVMG